MARHRGLAHAAVLAAMLAAALPAVAQTCHGPEDLGTPAAAAPLVPGQFGRAGAEAALGCALPPGGERRVQAVPFLACLRIGAVGVGDDIAAVEQVLGAPDRVVPLHGAVESRIYFIRQRSLHPPYYVVTVRGGKVVALQLHGPPTELPLSFSSLALGDPSQRVLDVLGRPSRHCRDAARGTDTWFYAPYPFSLDLADGAVIGIRMSVPVTREDVTQ